MMFEMLVVMMREVMGLREKAPRFIYTTSWISSQTNTSLEGFKADMDHGLSRVSYARQRRCPTRRRRPESLHRLDEDEM